MHNLFITYINLIINHRTFEVSVSKELIFVGLLFILSLIPLVFFLTMGKVHPPSSGSENWKTLQKELQGTSGGVKKKVGKKDAKNLTGNSLNVQMNKWKNQQNEIKASTTQMERKKSAQRVLAIDCEYVGAGFEGRDDILARVSIVDVNGSVLYDKYVIPTEEVTDYRTQVSGIRPGHLERGEPKPQVQLEVSKLLNGSIVVGHGLNNDFKVLGFPHPAEMTRDTARYKPLREILKDKPRKTPSLKLLAYKILGVQIQQGEHDSITDARTALRIYQLHQTQWDQEVRSKAGNKHKGKKKR